MPRWCLEAVNTAPRACRAAGAAAYNGSTAARGSRWCPRAEELGCSCRRAISSSSRERAASSAGIWSRSCDAGAGRGSARSTSSPSGEWYQQHDGVENVVRRPARRRTPATRPPQGASTVYNLAADMGGMGFIENNKAAVHALGADQHAHAAWRPATHGVERFFYSSSACVYNADKQTDADVTALKEEDAYPAMPEDGYGWEKLFSERMCRHFREDFGLDDPRGPLPQRLRPVRHLGRRPREGPRRHLPQGDRGQARRRRTRSRSGATASRPAASCTSTTASRASHMLTHSDIREPINLGSDRAGHHQPAGRHRRGHRRRQARARATSSTRPRASAAATATTP